jgi:hypothetical protein
MENMCKKTSEIIKIFVAEILNQKIKFRNNVLKEIHSE